MTTNVTEAPPHIDLRVPAGPGLFALALGGLAIGTTEFATMGVLPDIAGGLNTSIPTAGHLISLYALGVVVGAPLASTFAVLELAPATTAPVWGYSSAGR